jgi:hypothetical protein
MKVHKIIKRAVILCAILCTGIALPGCIDSSVAITNKLDELSLTAAFNEVVEKTNVYEDTVGFRKLRLHTDKSGLIDSLSFSFYAVSKTSKETLPVLFDVQMNSKGELEWDSLENDSSYNTYPGLQNGSRILEEIDKLGLSSIVPGDNGLVVQIDLQQGDMGYSRPQSELYCLQDGKLIPLDKVVFHSNDYWTTISVFENLAGKTGETFQTGDGETSQIWFLAEDLNKAGNCGIQIKFSESR